MSEDGYEEIVLVDDECRPSYNMKDPAYLNRLRAIREEGEREREQAQRAKEERLQNANTT